MPTTFAEATHIDALDSHTYTADFKEDWCIGSGKPVLLTPMTMPHGGYVTSCFLSVANLHFATTLRGTDQPHALTLHLEFLRRTSVGPAVFTVKDLKIGRQTSTVQISLVQDNNREEVVGYITHSSLASASGVTVPTNWALQPPPVPVSLTRLGNGSTDANWTGPAQLSFASFRKAVGKYHIHLPRRGQHDRSIIDEWLCFANGERLTQLALGSVVDTFPQLIDAYKEEHSTWTLPKGLKWGHFWYPTLSLSLEVKKTLPPEGVDFLFLRCRAKEIKNGRLDLEITVLDGHGELVALSQHVSFVLSAGRNMAQRSNGGGGKEGSKI